MRRKMEDIFYDASEEDSEVEMGKRRVALQQKAAREPTTKTWPSNALIQVQTGYSTIDDEEFSEEEEALGRKAWPNRMRSFRHASWPVRPSTPSISYYGGVQGIQDTASGGDERKARARKLRRQQGRFVFTRALAEGLWSAFGGIADADSIEERSRQIKLEEHMDKIFNAVAQQVDQGAVDMTDAAIQVARERLEKETVSARPLGEMIRCRACFSSLARLLGCMGRFEGGKEGRQTIVVKPVNHNRTLTAPGFRQWYCTKVLSPVGYSRKATCNSARENFPLNYSPLASPNLKKNSPANGSVLSTTTDNLPQTSKEQLQLIFQGKR